MCEIIRFPEHPKAPPETRISFELLHTLPGHETFLALDDLQLCGARAALNLLAKANPKFKLKTALRSQVQQERILQVAAFLLRRAAERVRMPILDDETLARLKEDISRNPN